MTKDWDLLQEYCQTDDERTTLDAAKRGIDLNDMGMRILRRVEARTPEMRAKLNGYNKTYSARKRRITKGEWPEDAPTSSQLVKLGLLSQEDAHNTKKYIRVVTTFLAPAPSFKKTGRYGNTRIVYVNADAEVETPDNVVVSKVSRSPKPRSGHAKIVKGKDYSAGDKPDQVDVGQTAQYLEWTLRHIQEQLTEAIDAIQKIQWEHNEQNKFVPLAVL